MNFFIFILVKLSDNYQMRGERAIHWFWILVQFVYVFAMYLRNRSFSLAVSKMRSQNMCSIIEFVCQEATNRVSFALSLRLTDVCMRGDRTNRPISALESIRLCSAFVNNSFINLSPSSCSKKMGS